MKFEGWSFTKHFVRIRIEGYQINRLLSGCIKENIYIRHVVYKDETEITAVTSYDDYIKIKKLAKSKYKITIVREKGVEVVRNRLLKRKLALIGFCIFVMAIAVQSMFIKEVEIVGYKSIPEEEIRLLLEKGGLYEGCLKTFNCSDLEKLIYMNLEDVVWTRVAYEGRYALVEIAERNDRVPATVDKDKPCSIVADRDCYIEEILPYKGVAVKKKGDFVKKGKTIISGKVPLTSSAYGTEAENLTEYYVHAKGTVKARVPYEISFDMAISSEDEIRKAANIKIRSWAKKNMPEKAQILNNSLNFTPKENIMKVHIVIEVLQYVGEEREIVIGEQNRRVKENSN